MLMSLGGLGFNPLFCMVCRGEVDPESLGLDQEEVDSIANWRSVYGAVDALELHSGDYEAWAQSELQRISSPINAQAFEVIRMLTRHRPAYFNFWQGDNVYESCPVGGDPLRPVDGAPGRAVCDEHRVVVLRS